MTIHRRLVVIGGGFYGCMIAHHLSRQFPQVILLEKHHDLMQRASYSNQARVHNGYHYPRSLLTALRSRVNFPRFTEEFRNCIDGSFEKYYAIARRFCKVTARQFTNLCDRIGVPAEPAPPAIRRLFRADLIEDVFRVEECAFDAVKLKREMWDRLQSSGVDVRLNAAVLKVEPWQGRLRVSYQTENETVPLLADRVFNCTYSQVNVLLANSGLPIIPLKHEVAELALVKVPQPLDQLGVTVMCGPFFSFMPFPARGLHSFSHVRYTPHSSWHDEETTWLDGHRYLDDLPKTSRFPAMIRDAARFMPQLQDCEYVDSLWEIKSVLPASERNDSRPILMKNTAGMPGLTSVLAAKIDNVYDILDVLDQESVHQRQRKAA